MEIDVNLVSFIRRKSNIIKGRKEKRRDIQNSSFNAVMKYINQGKRKPNFSLSDTKICYKHH